jgi:hypothetical protein
MMKRIIGLLLFITVAACRDISQEFTAKLSSPEIRIGEQATIEFECQFSAVEKQIMMPALKDTITKFIEIVDVSIIDTTFDQDDITLKYFTQTVTITSWDSGLHVIPPFKVVIGNDTLYSEPILLSVTTVALQEEQDITDIKSIIDVPFSLWDWILGRSWLLGTIAGIILLLVIAYLVYRKFQNQPQIEEIVVIPKEDADLIANRKLKELESKKVWQKGEVKEYHSNLSYIVREYIENRFEINALEQTTDEISMLLIGHSEVHKSDLAQLIQMLQLADMAKFAKQQPIAVENEQALKTAYNFIEKTKIESHETTDSNTLNPAENDA